MAAQSMVSAAGDMRLLNCQDLGLGYGPPPGASIALGNAGCDASSTWTFCLLYTLGNDNDTVHGSF